MSVLFKLFLSLLFVVSNNLAQQCCEGIAVSKPFEADLKSCFDSDDITCANFECLMDKRGIMKGHFIDEDAAKANFQKIIESRPGDKGLIESIDKECLQNSKFDKYSEKEDCPAADFFTCVFVTVHVGCPKWKTSDVCNKMAENAKKCKEYVESA